MMVISVLTLVLGIPVATFVIECVLGCLIRKKTVSADRGTPSTSAIIIPAHNEAAVIEATLESLLPQTTADDIVIVVADNCTDNTAEIARKFPINVVERSSEKDRGKGFALAFGMKQLPVSSPEIIVIVDADCLLTEHALVRLKQTCKQYQRPVQAKYLILNKPNAKIAGKISAFAILVKNFIRMRGAAYLRFPALLTGTGMAFPYQALKNAPLASGEIVEDMKLGIDLAIAGYSPKFVEDAYVYSFFPDENTDLSTQRERWEHGHMGLITSKIIPLFKNSLTQLRADLFGLMLDLLIPPLAFLVALIGGATVAAAALFLVTGYALPLLILTLYLSFITLCVILMWFTMGRNILSATEILSLPLYVASKLKSYLKFFSNRETNWKKTKR